MRVRGGGLVPFVAAVVAGIALLAPGGAGAATVVNGNFEKGNLSGWQVHRVTKDGNWYAYKGTVAPIKGRPQAGPVQAPPQGAYAAISDEINPDTLILSQDVALEPGSTHWLSLLAYYRSYDPLAIPSPDTLSVDDEVLGGQANQQFRIDVMRPTAPIESVDPADVLSTLLRTLPGGPLKLPPTQLVADLSAFAGQTVRLRMAVAAREEIFNAGIDAVSISPRPPAAGGGGGLGPKGFRVGKAKPNRKNGTVLLPVQVSGPGLVQAKSVVPKRGASASKAGKPRKLVRPASVRAAAAGTVKLRLRTTAAGREILARKLKLRAKVSVTYRANGEPARTTVVPVVFKLAPRPTRR